MEAHPLCGTLNIPQCTRKPCYRKDDGVMHPTYGCPDNFRESLVTPTATFPEIVNGLLFGTLVVWTDMLRRHKNCRITIIIIIIIIALDRIEVRTKFEVHSFTCS